MHANEQMALAVKILQPSADEVISNLEIQPGERFIDPEEKATSRGVEYEDDYKVPQSSPTSVVAAPGGAWRGVTCNAREPQAPGFISPKCCASRNGWHTPTEEMVAWFEGRL